MRKGRSLSLLYIRNSSVRSRRMSHYSVRPGYKMLICLGGLRAIRSVSRSLVSGSLQTRILSATACCRCFGLSIPWKRHLTAQRTFFTFVFHIDFPERTFTFSRSNLIKYATCDSSHRLNNGELGFKGKILILDTA